jgi:glycosyltransferase involved in cell wall biosynthesis
VDPPFVSIVLPVFNGEKTINDAINSVLGQTCVNFELIICNDASTDNTHELLTKIDDARVRVINNISNLGEGLSRDKAISHSVGKWLAFIDADDVWLPERLEKMTDIAKREGEAFIFDNIIDCHDSKSGLKPWRIARDQNAFGSNGQKSVNVSLEQLILAKRSLIKPLIPLNIIRKFSITHSTTKYAADLEFFLQVLSKKKIPIWYLTKPMYLYRITAGSASANKSRYELYSRVLEKSRSLFIDSPTIQSALLEKISDIKREEKYFAFILAIKTFHFLDVFMIINSSPWVLVELWRRIGSSFGYHVHRLISGGKVRGSY